MSPLSSRERNVRMRHPSQFAAGRLIAQKATTTEDVTAPTSAGGISQILEVGLARMGDFE